MRQILVRLQTERQSVEYAIDAESGSFNSSIIREDGERTVMQSGSIGVSDVEKQDLALKMYHIMLAALRA